MRRTIDRTPEALEARLGYKFSERPLLVRALTHRSAAPAAAPSASYQRLEFLGDRVLGLVVARLVYEAYPEAEEGELAYRYNRLVRKETLADMARALDIGAAIRLGPGEAHSGGRRKDAILADVCEAVIAAIFLDGGFDAARAFVERHWGDRLADDVAPLRDAKTTLQEWAQGRGLPIPTYEPVGREGPDHAPEFTVRVLVPGVPEGEGRGKSKREAEQAAATRVLVREGIWADDGNG